MHKKDLFERHARGEAGPDLPVGIIENRLDPGEAAGRVYHRRNKTDFPIHRLTSIHINLHRLIQAKS
jgi:hypothetical protein